MNKSNRHIIDRLGIITSGLCAIHCAAIPVLLSFGLIGGISGTMHHNVELLVITASAFLGIMSIYNGLNGHGRILPQVLISIGAFCIIMGFLVSMLGHLVMAIGGISLLYGHWLNWRQLSIQD